MELSPTHIHLLLNHFPTVAFAVALGLLIFAVIGKSEELKEASLVILFLLAVLAIPTYVSGNAAQAAIMNTEGVSQARISDHESAALVGFIFMEITGFIAWLGLWQARLIKRIAAWCAPAVLVSAILTFLLMANAANLGGEIRHPELFGNGDAASQSAGSTFARAVGSFVTNNTSVWPTCETLHFVGLSLLFAVVLIVDLRMLGMAKSISFSALYQLLPFGMLGFVLNLITGMMFFISTPGQYIKGYAFAWKMVFVVLGGINVLYFMLFDEPWHVGAGDDAPLTSKLVAASAIVVWVGVLFWGHMLPFIGQAF
jgi:uncharacterized membrane protein